MNKTQIQKGDETRQVPTAALKTWLANGWSVVGEDAAPAPVAKPAKVAKTKAAEVVEAPPAPVPFGRTPKNLASYLPDSNSNGSDETPAGDLSETDQQDHTAATEES